MPVIHGTTGYVWICAGGEIEIKELSDVNAWARVRAIGYSPLMGKLFRLDRTEIKPPKENW